MASGGAFGGARGLAPRPPEKGVFPLDHFGECAPAKEAYMACLKERRADARACQPLARAYLQCRMERNLMAPQDLDELGFPSAAAAAAGEAAPPPDERRREATGFVAGVRGGPPPPGGGAPNEK